MEKIAVVVGGTSGIGRRTAERLLAEGWKVWVLGSKSAGPSWTGEYGEGLRYRQCDVRDHASIQHAFESVAGAQSAIDALIYSSGVNNVGELESIAVDKAEQMFDVNLKGLWLTIREAIPMLRKNASTENPARVIVVGSIGGLRPKVSGGIYGASKAAAHVIAQVFAVELGPTGITVNVVAPGSTDTPMIASAVADGAATGYRASGTSPLGRIGQADDVADSILFLLGDGAKYINGVILPVDGGTRAAYDNRS